MTEIVFLTEKNESLKTTILNSFSEEGDKESTRLKISNEFGSIIKEINENSNIQIISKNKNEEDISILLDELILDHKELKKSKEK